MRTHHLGGLPPGRAGGGAAAADHDAFDAVLRGRSPGASADTMERADQVAFDIAQIERAAAALRKAEPALEAWPRASAGNPPAPSPRQPRPVWLLVGMLWLSTALVTAGAVATIARLAG